MLGVRAIREAPQTFILLHGRGSTAQKFAEPLLSHIVAPHEESDHSTDRLPFRSCFPNAKMIFPTAALRRATIYRRSLTHQWFDNWSLDQSEYQEELQLNGLMESTTFVHNMLQKEIDIIGSRNVLIIGLSQGCATALVSLLTWEGAPFAAVIGMCGLAAIQETNAGDYPRSGRHC